MSSSCLLVQLTLLVAVIIPGSRTFDCVTPTKDPNAPHMPEIMSDSYQAHIELNILDKNKTWAIEEYLDYAGNRGARLVSEGNKNTKYIYSFDTDEIFTINDDDTCTVVNMSSPEASSLTFGFGSRFLPNDGDKRHVFGAAATFKLARGTTDFYAGKDTVRGIAANKWTRCVPGPIKMQVSYYFSAPDWTMPLNIQMPLRIEVEAILPGPSPRYIHHNYDFIGYRPDIEAKSTMFETPKDVICTGRKNTKALPTFTNQFQYSAENVDPVKQGIMHFNVWYDGVSRLVRIDKRDVEPRPPLYTTNPVTEIHDHNTGVRYIKDRLFGNCSIHPLSSNSVDSLQDPQKTIELSDPSRFFSFTKNYTYTGQRAVRGILCDVYAAVIPNYSYEGITGNAVFSYYFLSSPPWQDQPLQGSTFDNKRYPVHLEIIVLSTDFVKIVNFFDFDDLATDMSKFDVSDCFDEKNKLDFRVIFPGKYDPSTETEFKYYATYALANAIALSPIRIGNLAITSDLNNVFLSGSLLGTSAQAQFQLVDKKSPERVLEKTFFSVKLPDQCADMCVKNKPDLCQGYQYCPDDGFSCGLSMYHVLNQTIKTDGKSCAFFTRTISNYPYPKEPTISQAYDALAKSIKDKNLHLLVTLPNGFQPNYIAIGLRRLSGYSTTTKPMPSMPSQFSYRMETVVPKFVTSFDSYVWYDAKRKVVRLDTRDANTPDATEFSNIYDFNTGVMYKISKVTNECEIKPISATDDFNVNSFSSKPDKMGGLQIKMKTPLEIFFMDDTYTYIGQRSVRGILCDAYQAQRSDFHVQALDLSTEISVFTIYFQADHWKYYTADSLDTSTTQPVQLTIEDKTAEIMTVYNVFDFNDEEHTVDYFDASACYTADQTKSFEIIFKNQPFHPFLDGKEPTFKGSVIMRMSDATSTSPLRFQQVSVSHDESNVYVIASVLGNVPPYTLFQRVTNVTLNSTAQTIFVGSYQDCAAACFNQITSGTSCNSFDYCPVGNSPTCSLMTKTDEQARAGTVNATGPCIHYSRSELGNYPIAGVDLLYTAITNAVYDNKFAITMYMPNGESQVYTATDIRDDILISTDPASAAGSLLSQYSKTVNMKLPDSAITETHTMVSITDCALSCTTTTSLHCVTFEYNYDIGTCRLSAKHLDEITTPLSKATNVNIYTTFYTKDYKQYGNVFLDKPDKVITAVASSELCARDCNEETKFNCESFEYCPDQSTCNLRKDHTLPTITNQKSGQTPTCVLYSRHHLYDYTKHSNSLIVGHDDLVTTAMSDSDCARLCANGELKGCASFEVCHASRGITKCVLSLADPTLQTNLTKETTRECNLYTKGNPTKAISKGKGTTTVPVVEKQTTTKSDTGTTVPVVEKQTTTKSDTGTTVPVVEKQTTTKSDTGTTVPVVEKQTTTKSDTGTTTVPVVEKQTTTKSDTGARVGIAFGTLFLGLLVGAVGMFLFSKWRASRAGGTDDSHQLRDYNGVH